MRGSRIVVMAHLNLDLQLCKKLRKKINEYQHYSITKTHSIKKAPGERGWAKICAIMDRLDDTSLYLNSLELQKSSSVISVFDFYNFMNNSATMLDCINFLAEIYEFDFSSEDYKSDIFNQVGKTGNGTDKRYFEYLRSLCSVHPIETSRHSEFQDDFTQIECSPFVRWNDSSLLDDRESDLIAIVYVNNPQQFSKYVGIKLSEVFSYIEHRYNLLQRLIEHIDLYYQGIIDEYRKIPLKTVFDFSDYCDYLEYMKRTYAVRIKSGWDEYFDFYIYAMKIHFSNSLNQQRLVKYQNAIKYAFTFLHRYLQELPKEDSYETTGLHDQPEKSIGDSLFWELQERPIGTELMKYNYPFEKLLLMWMQPRYMGMADFLIKELKPFWGKYVCFESNMTPIEISILLTVACHFYKLEHDEDFKNNIPNTKDYR